MAAAVAAAAVLLQAVPAGAQSKGGGGKTDLSKPGDGTAVHGSNLIDGTVVLSKLAEDLVGRAELDALTAQLGEPRASDDPLAVHVSRLRGWIDGSLLTGTIDTSLLEGPIDTAVLRGQIDASRISGGLGPAQLQDGAVGRDHLAPGAVTSSAVGAGQVLAEHRGISHVGLHPSGHCVNAPVGCTHSGPVLTGTRTLTISDANAGGDLVQSTGALEVQCFSTCDGTVGMSIAYVPLLADGSVDLKRTVQRSRPLRTALQGSGSYVHPLTDVRRLLPGRWRVDVTVATSSQPWLVLSGDLWTVTIGT